MGNLIMAILKLIESTQLSMVIAQLLLRLELPIIEVAMLVFILLLWAINEIALLVLIAISVWA
jgi:hypothetical protein